MKTNRSRLWMTTLVAFLSFAALVSSCKKDTYVGTVGLCPVVVSTNPNSNATLVPLNQVISATFNEKMDPASFSQASFAINGTALKASIPGIVSYNATDSTMSFTPTGRLALHTSYECIVKATVKDLRGNFLQTDYRWVFSTGPVVDPIVTLTDPINNATNVATNKIINATFSIPMDPSTITSSTFTIMAGTTPVSGAVTYAGLIATFTGNLLPGTVYTATITTGAMNADGTPLQANYVWTFTTGIPPTVVSTDPTNNATGVVLNKIVRANFSIPLNALTITNTTFTLKQGTTPVAGSVSYSGSRASFTPASPLAVNTVYTATITTGALSVAGMPMTNDYVWSFTTSTVLNPAVTLTDPLNNAVNVALNKKVTATFNMPMDPATITNPLTFTLKAGAISVSGVVTYVGSVATFSPAVDLLSNTTYTATITTGAKNPAGTAIANNYVWNFSTGATVVIVTPGAIDLGSADQFGILAGVGVSNAAGPSVINNMNVGIYPGLRSSVTGFPPATLVNGAIFAADDIAPPGVAAMLLQAKTDLTNAYLAAEGATSPAPATVSGDQGGKTLAPGIYKSTSTLLIQNGDLTLDAQGDANAVWIFQVASGFTTVGGAGGDVILTGGAQAKNVYWQTGSSAVIGDYTSFQGNVLALQSITMNAYSTATGRMLARNGSVVMTSTNTINKP